MRRWPLFLIALPAAVAIWSGWVGLGGLCGFGVVNLLPGIAHASLNTAITLPVGVEAYAAFALGVWMGSTGSDRARTFARRSAIGALAYGMLGQVVYHLLAAAHVTAAPWPVVVGVSCMPVVVLGFAAALTHLLRAAEDVAGEGSPQGASPSSPPTQRIPAAVPIPGVQEIRDRRGCGQKTAQKARDEVRLYARRRDALDSPAGAAAPNQTLGLAPAGVHLNGGEKAARG